MLPLVGLLFASSPVSAAPSVIVAESGGSTDVTEGGATDTYTVVLGEVPSGTVTITVGLSSQVSVSSSTLTFSTIDWATPQQVTVTAIDDAIGEGSHSAVITHSASGGGYDAVAISSVVASITDDDPPSISVAEPGGTTQVIEGGLPDTYQLNLDSEPTGATVVVTIQHDPQVFVSPEGFVVLKANWQAALVVTITAVDDSVVEGLQTSTISHSASGGGYDGATVSDVTVSLTDNDVAGVTITLSDGATGVTEGGGSDSYDVVLDAEPFEQVLISLAPDAEVNVTPSALIFQPGNWDTARSVVVTAVDDSNVEGDHFGNVAHTAFGGAYDSVGIAGVSVAISDNDGNVSVSQSAGATLVTEGGTADGYSIVLDAEPSASVTITITAGAGIIVSPLTLVFSTLDWSTSQSVGVLAIDDAVVGGTHTSTITHTATGGGYGPVAISSIVVKITDNDPASVTITESGGSTDLVEGGVEDSYDVVLGAQPAGTVVISVVHDQNVSTSVNSLTFLANDWNTPQTVSVSAPDDAVVESLGTSLISHSASGGGYGSVVIQDVIATVVDAQATFAIVESGGNTRVVEGGPSDTYNIVLDAEPTATVTVTATPDMQVSVTPATLTFTPANWDVPQTINLSALIDNIVEGAHTSTISHSASGGGYLPGSILSLAAGIVDLDTPGVTIVESDGATDVKEGGVADAYDLVLNVEPSGTVTIVIGTDTNASTSPSSLTFGPNDWSVPQTVLVKAVDDALIEGPHTTTLAHTSSGGGYESLEIADVISTVADADPRVSIIEINSPAVMIEGGIPHEYQIVLEAKPTDNVTIVVQSDDEIVPVPAGLVFTPENWSVRRTVSLISSDDDVVEGNRTTTLAHTATGGGFDTAVIPDLVVTLVDDDGPGLVFIESEGATTLSEGGEPDSYTVALKAEPAGAVVVEVRSDDHISVSPARLTFLPTDWGSPQTVTAAALNDAVIEGVHSSTISHVASGGGYDDAPPSGLLVRIADAAAGVSVTPLSALASAEGDPPFRYELTLLAKPLDQVIIAIESNSQVVLSTSTLTFSPQNWDEGQVVSVAIVDDGTVQGQRAAQIKHSASGGGYDGAAIDDISLTIADNDIARVGISAPGAATELDEGGPPLTYTISLASSPSGIVYLSIHADDSIALSPDELIFTPANWDVPQTISVSAVEDELPMGSVWSTSGTRPSVAATTE